MHIITTIQGTTALLMAHFGFDAEEGLAAPSRRVKVHELPRREQAEKLAYRMPDQRLCLPGPAFLSALCNVGGNHKQRGNRKSLRFIVPAAVRIPAEFIPLHRPQSTESITDFEVDTRRAVNQSTKGAVLAHRPRIDAWAATLDLIVNENLIDAATVQLLLTEAGEQVGVGAFRPEKKGPFGTFRVVDWRERDRALDAAAE